MIDNDKKSTGEEIIIYHVRRYERLQTVCHESMSLEEWLINLSFDFANPRIYLLFILLLELSIRFM